jgi:metal-responsive CopG/Arc/MetJ family transcriptional regulator
VKKTKIMEMRRNITLSLPRRLLSKAKLTAVRQDKSLSEFMREALEQKIEAGSDYQKAMRRQLGMLSQGFDVGTGGRLAVAREELHERS